MSTGTGIFLAGLIIGLVMLYGQTKDRWNWQAIPFYFLVVIVFGIIVTYDILHGWSRFQYDGSPHTFIAGFLTYFSLLVVAGIPIYFASKFYQHLLNEDFQYDKEGNERTIYKGIFCISLILLLFLHFFFGNSLREIIRLWIYG